MDFMLNLWRTFPFVHLHIAKQWSLAAHVVAHFDFIFLTPFQLAVLQKQKAK